MGILEKKKIKLILEDGSIYPGYSFGAFNSTSGEVVFNTGMMGYPESMTDPSYRGQILVLTYPLIGNYGVPDDSMSDDMPVHFESSSIHIRGLVVSDYSAEHSHWNAKRSLSEWMAEQNIPGIYGIDTRALTKKLRHKGVMLGKIVADEDVKIDDPNKKNLVAEVSVSEPKFYKAEGEKKKVLLIDCGVKHNIIRCFLKRKVSVYRVPWDHDFLDELEQHDGLFISNGPGDPKMCKATIKNLSKAMKMKKPVFGICLGNQLLALAAGGNTYKLKFGHRSQNQPCIDMETGRCYITSQNHGFAVDSRKLDDFVPSFMNANDNTNEGLRHRTRQIFSVQFHPEATPGPNDTEFMFD